MTKLRQTANEQAAVTYGALQSRTAGKVLMMSIQEKISNVVRGRFQAKSLRGWIREDLVLATDTDYLVLGACERGSMGDPCQGTQLQREDRIQVQFWLIPRELNMEAGTLAKSGAQQFPEPDELSPIMTINI
ncbi:hypothetical protein M422DRAFT_784645 [Sphaerobolus stellatus SS14]|uniref:Uncharacterized protein n=1 Tax=Sphaerobolus stellatus (strain SS14) TaxID=990650 RepID=A0A0C9UGK5_SPHS4|nr:hypothetical protein M422DRAFT_784645 [Sphaerobolus stellatus SS14]